MIPKIIHYFWVGGNPKPKSVLQCIKSWKKYCPDYKIMEWNESNYDFNKNAYMKQAFENKRWGFVTDCARFDVIYEYGGIYLDTDVELIKNLDSLLTHNSFFGYEEADDYYINCGSGFGSCAKNPIIKDLRDYYDNVYFVNDDATLNLIPLPIHNMHIFKKIGVNYDNSLQNIDENVFYPSDYFCPKNFETGLLKITDNTYSIHHYDASWYNDKQQEEKKERWKAYKSEYNKDYIMHLPNRILKKLLGEDNYDKLKKKTKK